MEVATHCPRRIQNGPREAAEIAALERSQQLGHSMFHGILSVTFQPPSHQQGTLRKPLSRCRCIASPWTIRSRMRRWVLSTSGPSRQQNRARGDQRAHAGAGCARADVERGRFRLEELLQAVRRQLWHGDIPTEDLAQARSLGPGLARAWPCQGTVLRRRRPDVSRRSASAAHARSSKLSMLCLGSEAICLP